MPVCCLLLLRVVTRAGAGAEMQIDTGDSAPIRSRMRKSIMAEDFITKNHICHMSGRKVVEYASK